MKRTSRLSRVAITVVVVLLAAGMTMPFGALAQSQEEDEPNDAQEAATAIEGTSVDGEITKQGGTDWFSKEFTAGETASFAVSKSIREEGLKMELYAPNGSKIDQNFGYHGVGRMEVTAPADESGEYHVEIEAVDESYTDVPYTVYAPADEAPPKKRSTEPVSGTQQEDEPNDNQSNQLTGQEVSGEISSENDTDWYAFQANANQNISLLLTKPTDEEVYVRTDVHAPDESYDPSDVYLSEGDTREQIVIEIEPNGMYYLEISGDTSKYTIQFPGEDLPIQPGGSANGGAGPAEPDESDTATDTLDSGEETDTSTSMNQNTQTENDDQQEATNTDTSTTKEETTTTDEESVTNLFGPGFTGGGAVVALFVTALFALRRRV